jgi:hypothetical protein
MIANLANNYTYPVVPYKWPKMPLIIVATVACLARKEATISLL